MTRLTGSTPSRVSLSDFDERRVSARTPIIELNAVFPLSDLRDVTQTSGTGAVTDETSEYRVRHAAAGDFARLASASRGRYQPGMNAEAGIGVRLSSDTIAGDGAAYWGYFDMGVSGGSDTENINNGFVFGLDSEGLFVQVFRSGSSQAKVYRDDWNGDRPPIDLTDGNIFQIDYTYYGYGIIKFQRLKVDAGNGRQEVDTLHSVHVTGTTSMTNSNLQIGAMVKSSSGAGDFSMYVAGRQYSIVGLYRPRDRIIGEAVTGKTVGTGAMIPIVSFRRKASLRQIGAQIGGYDVNTDNTLLIQIRVGSTLTDASFGAISDQDSGETALEVDTSATAVNTGTGAKVYEGIARGGQTGNAADLTSLDKQFSDIPDEAIVTFCAQAISTEATVDFVSRMIEQW